MRAGGRLDAVLRHMILKPHDRIGASPHAPELPEEALVSVREAFAARKPDSIARLADTVARRG